VNVKTSVGRVESGLLY